jgi:hypothetical protein
MTYTNHYHFVSIPRRLLTIHTQCLPRERPPPPNNHGLQTPRIAAVGGRLTLWWLRTTGAGLRRSFVAPSAATTNSNNLGKQTWLTLLAWPIHIKFRYYCYYYLDYIIYRLNKKKLSDIPIHIKFRYYYYIMMMSKFMFYARPSRYWPNCWDGKTKKKRKRGRYPTKPDLPRNPSCVAAPSLLLSTAPMPSPQPPPVSPLPVSFCARALYRRRRQGSYGQWVASHSIHGRTTLLKLHRSVATFWSSLQCVIRQINKSGEMMYEKIKKLDKELARYKEQICKTHPAHPRRSSRPVPSDSSSTSTCQLKFNLYSISATTLSVLLFVLLF